MESIKCTLTRAGKIHPARTWSISTVMALQLQMQFWKLLFGFINDNKMRLIPNLFYLFSVCLLCIGVVAPGCLWDTLAEVCPRTN